MKYETKYRQRRNAATDGELLLKIRAALALDRMDLVKELSYEFQVVLEKEHNLKQFNFLKL